MTIRVYARPRLLFVYLLKAPPPIAIASHAARFGGVRLARANNSFRVNARTKRRGCQNPAELLETVSLLITPSEAARLRHVACPADGRPHLPTTDQDSAAVDVTRDAESSNDVTRAGRTSSALRDGRSCWRVS